MTDQEFQYLKKKILKLTNIDLEHYKSQQMRRRLDMFVSHSGAKDTVDYCHLLEKETEKLKALQTFLTINVSEFFRDWSPFEQLKISVLPLLLKNSPRLNIWSAGCSHGAEPYSIAMILESISPGVAHRILGTDIDEGALKQARTGGPYHPAEVKNVPPNYLRRYFTSSNGNYAISDKIKQTIEFKQHNLLRDQFEKDFDLIICRNVTIYFTDETKKKLNQKFYQSLKNGGVLLIGATEVIFDITSIGFKGLKTSFYQKPVTGTPVESETRKGVLLKTR